MLPCMMITRPHIDDDNEDDGGDDDDEVKEQNIDGNDRTWFSYKTNYLLNNL